MDFYSIATPQQLESEAFQLLNHAKWKSMAELFLEMYWQGIRNQLYELVQELGLHSCTITLIHQTRNQNEFVERTYNNIRVSLDLVQFPPPLKPMFLDNLACLLEEKGFKTEYTNRQQTVDISLDWSQPN
eukprot:TRINITY_DN654_c1_g2_i2.p1 TRINITY_DN654_c1_g2~~TRINITY_DN654_c1_g2_i2.p1  ORF type:complete len:130 (+),score=35.82 TRINITY_DN654_c1_g2_i2:430-819(+)